MRYVVTNIKKLVNIFTEVKTFLAQNPSKTITVTWDIMASPKTKAQLGFAWGVIIDCVFEYYRQEFGKEYDKEVIKEMLYLDCGIDEKLYTPNGKVIKTSKRMSRMTKEEMSEFINNMLNWCDEYEITLPAEARYLWLHHLDPRYVEEVRQAKFHEHDAEYLAYVRKSYCLICGKHICDAHHYKHHSLCGMGGKSPDWAAVEICHECHVRPSGHISSNEIKRLCPYIFKHIDEVTFLKLKYDRWRRHR